MSFPLTTPSSTYEYPPENKVLQITLPGGKIIRAQTRRFVDPMKKPIILLSVLLEDSSSNVQRLVNHWLHDHLNGSSWSARDLRKSRNDFTPARRSCGTNQNDFGGLGIITVSPPVPHKHVKLHFYPFLEEKIQPYGHFIGGGSLGLVVTTDILNASARPPSNK